jgi:hypothetical protein
MAFKAEVIADDSGKFVGNALVFETREEAEDYARDLRSRWILVREWRVVETDEPVTYTFTTGYASRIGTL